MRAFPGLRGLGKLAQIGDLGQVEVGQVVDQVCDVGAAGGVGHLQRLQDGGKSAIFLSAATLLLIRRIISSGILFILNNLLPGGILSTFIHLYSFHVPRTSSYARLS